MSRVESGGSGYGRRDIWEDSLRLERYPDLRSSLVGELAEYLGLDAVEVLHRCRAGAGRLAEEWEAAAPSGSEEVSEFYRGTDAYVYDLTWWHSLSEDESALVQVEALEVALEHRAGKVLDFGGGIGSLGILLAAHDLDVTIVEINARLRDYARHRFEGRGLSAHITDTSSEPLPDSAFDFISAVDVMEHLPEPEETLRDLAAALKPGGTLYLHLPPEADTSRPMHLWHGTKFLLRHVGDAGLWLEKADESSLVLRRGDPPMYRLNSGIRVEATKQGRMLTSRRPLMATRLNDGAANLLERLGDGKSAAELSRETKLSLSDTTSFLDGLAGKRILLRERKVVAPRLPTVTVIVPAKDRPSQTRDCVETLTSQDYPPELVEVIVVDDGSRVPLAESLSGLPVRVIRVDTSIGQSAARNLAAREARGEVLAFTDNDCEAEPGWLKRIVVHLSEPGIDVVGGRILSPPPDGNVAAFEAVRSSLDMGDAGSMVGFGENVVYLPTCNLAVDRAVYLNLGGMDEEMSLGEDADFVWRAADSGSGIYYEPGAGIVHHHRTNLWELLQRRADYASSEADLQHRHPKSRRQLMVPMVGVLVLASIPAFISAWWIGAFLLASILLILCVEFLTKRRRMKRAGFAMPVSSIVPAIARQHGASLYHLGTNICRYYSIPLLLASTLWLPLLPAVMVSMLIPAITDFRRLRPRMSVVPFVLLYWVELAAYQTGVWRGCIERRTASPLLAKLRFSR